ncbi:MAG: ion channel [Burkholderiaceae bacterium]|uniref:ion channel n=1 Tax=Hydrogenophaga sp. TaxID=1904254 RepID=UPI002753C158|nr:ion channel [Hydrogenophaga sp.]MDP2066431.1 ion channel [Burkholderiaceae bacterium]MDZ4144695.1 ion channel [Burkholderiales bacterium]MDZ4400927.1 ion channel [Hydrogenophaga sp.]
MLATVFTAVTLLALSTLVHYEVLRGLSAALPVLRIPTRSKLLVVLFAAFFAHALEIALYAAAYYGLVEVAHLGTLKGEGGASLLNCVYLSAETYTSLGFGDVVPTGPVRLIVGLEALNGLLLIGWSASYTYIAMERFWTEHRTE